MTGPLKCAKTGLYCTFSFCWCQSKTTLVLFRPFCLFVHASDVFPSVTMIFSSSSLTGFLFWSEWFWPVSNDVFPLVAMLSANHLTSPEVSYWLLFCLALFFSSRQDVDDLVLSVDRRGGSEQPNWDVSTRPLTRPFARLLAPLTHPIAPPCLLCSHAPLRICSLARSLTYSRARGEVNK